MNRIMIVVSAGILLAGCDFELPSQRRAREEAMRQETVKSAELEETKGECAALKHYVGVQLGLVSASLAEAEKMLAELVADRKKLSARLFELSEKSMADKTGTRETALYAVLKDEGVNAIALKYLGNDFAVLRSEFAEKMRFALNQERARKVAFDRNRANFDRAVEEGRARTDESRRMVSANIAQIKRDIAETESRLQRLRRDALSSSKQARESREASIIEAQHRLSTLRSRYTAMLASNDETWFARNAELDAARNRENASREREKADNAVRMQAKDDLSPFQLAEEYEERSIRRLDTVLQERDVLAHAQLKLTKEKMIYLTNITNGIDRLNGTGLQRVRADVDTLLAKKLPNDKEKSGR